MLTFSSLSGSAVRLSGAEKQVVAYADDPAKHAEKGAIALVSSPQESPAANFISWPGEYNEAGITIRGVGHNEGQQVSYVVQADKVRIAFLCMPLQDWTDKQLEMIGDIDVLVLPATDAHLTQKLVDEFDPRVLLIVPAGEKAALDATLKSVGAHGAPVGEYKIKGQLPQEGREVAVLGA